LAHNPDTQRLHSRYWGAPVVFLPSEVARMLHSLSRAVTVTRRKGDLYGWHDGEERRTPTKGNREQSDGAAVLVDSLPDGFLAKRRAKRAK